MAIFCATPHDVIELPEDDEEAPLKTTGRRGRASSRRMPVGPEPQSTSAPETVVQWSGDPTWATVFLPILCRLTVLRC